MKTDIEKLAAGYPASEEVVQVYRDWGETAYLQELFAELDAYEPDWNRECELGSWSAEFILDILQEREEEWAEMSPDERRASFRDLLDERYEDFRSSHQFARMNNATLNLREGEELEAVLAESDDREMFPKLSGE